MNEDEIRKKMTEAVDMVMGDIASIRTGRATPAIIEDLEVSVYGGQQRLRVNELATITTSDSQTIVLDPWDKSIIGEIKKGIETAKLGMNPVIDGEIIRISLPPMTTEDREKYVRLLSTKIENGRIMIRQIRGDAVKDIRAAFEEKELTEDEKFNQEKQLQDITDKFIDKIEKAGESKKQELLNI
jgi:ribosome recycling factor